MVHHQEDTLPGFSEGADEEHQDEERQDLLLWPSSELDGYDQHVDDDKVEKEHRHHGTSCLRGLGGYLQEESDHSEIKQ